MSGVLLQGHNVSVSSRYLLLGSVDSLEQKLSTGSTSRFTNPHVNRVLVI